MLLAAGYPLDLVLIADGDPHVPVVPGTTRIEVPERIGYWRCLQVATAARPADLLINLASDLLPGANWVRHLVEARQRSTCQVLALVDGINNTAHFGIDQAWLAAHGGWPVWYDHMCGDLEIAARARAERVFGIAWRAVLYHNHHIVGAAHDDIYALGEARWAHDKQLFAARSAAGWPHVG